MKLCVCSLVINSLIDLGAGLYSKKDQKVAGDVVEKKDVGLR
jgi:hypothetical protein